MRLNERQRSYLVQELDYRNKCMHQSWARPPSTELLASSILTAIYRTILKLDELNSDADRTALREKENNNHE